MTITHYTDGSARSTRLAWVVWSGPQRRYTSSVVERRACAAAAAQWHYVIRHMAHTPPVISYSTLPRKRRSYLLLWLLVFVCDLALGLVWLAAAVRELFSSREEPHVVVEMLRFSFLGLTLFTVMAWLAWVVVTRLRRSRVAG
jgi:hypothetical protein